MIVVFDTNIWLQHLYLRSSAGAAARFYIAHKNARVALPEVIRLEVEHHLRKDISSYIAKIKDSHERLLAMFGSLKEIVLPTETEIEKKISEAFSSLGVKFIEVPFSFASARSSFLKTINKIPPSDKDQQFKDGVLWADCLSLLNEDDVALVTEDKAFYENREYSKGLAVALRAECPSSARRLILISRLSDLLQEIRSQITIDSKALVDALIKHSDGHFGVLERNAFQLAEPTQVATELFITENPKVLFFEFKITFRCIDISGANRGDGSFEVQGDGLYNSAEGSFPRLAQLDSKLTFRNEQGEENEYRDLVMRIGPLVLGHKEVVHTLRYKLD